MPYPARTIAEWFLERAKRDGEFLTQMKLQKLVYIAHGWCLALLDQPLLQDEVEAWKWGPVIRSIYRDFAIFGSDPILWNSTSSVDSRLDGTVLKVLERVWEVYKRFTASELSSMTHQSGTPWSNSYRAENPRSKIPNESIMAHYQVLGQGRRNVSV